MKPVHARSAAFLVGLFSPFTVSLVGEMPVGELVLLCVLGWMAIRVMLDHRLPGRLWSNPLLRWMLVCQGVAFVGYVMSDFIWHSKTLDEVRGWARMVFLAIDLVTLAYLFTEGSGRALIWLLWGEVVGGVIQPCIMRPLFGDYWKFGFGLPVSLAVLLVLPGLGFWPGLVATLGLSALHFVLNFRSLGGLFLVLSGFLVLQRMPLRLRAVCIPVTALLAVGALAWIANRSATANRSHDLRSDISRKAMLKAAWHGVEDHPFIGNGSWLGRSGVINDYLAIRYATAQDEHLGGIGREEAPTGRGAVLRDPFADPRRPGGGRHPGRGVLPFVRRVARREPGLLRRPASVVALQRALYLFLLLLALFNLSDVAFLRRSPRVHRHGVRAAAASCGTNIPRNGPGCRSRRWHRGGAHPRSLPLSTVDPRMHKRNVIIYRRDLLPYSETFIREQSEALARLHAVLRRVPRGRRNAPAPRTGPAALGRLGRSAGCAGRTTASPNGTRAGPRGCAACGPRSCTRTSSGAARTRCRSRGRCASRSW